MLFFCVDQGVGVILWSLMVCGRLMCDWSEIMCCMQNDVFVL